MKKSDNNKLICKIFVAVIGFLFIAYSLFWFVIAGSLKEGIAGFEEDIAEQGYRLTDGEARVSGFPRLHKIVFSGNIKGEDGLDILVPDLEIKGMFLPGWEISISFPEGVKLLSSDDEYELFHLNKVFLSFIVPETVPAEVTYPNMKLWHEENGKLDITELLIRSETTSLLGTGRISLDERLQPALDADVTISGISDYLEKLRTADAISDSKFRIANAIISAIGQKDENTGKIRIETTVSVENQKLFIGPLRVASLPVVQWPLPYRDRHSPLDPHQ